MTGAVLVDGMEVVQQTDSLIGIVVNNRVETVAEDKMLAAVDRDKASRSPVGLSLVLDNLRLMGSLLGLDCTQGMDILLVDSLDNP